MLVSTVFLGLGGGVYRLWLTTIEAVENATKKVVMTVETTAGAASRLILVVSSSAEDIVMAITDEVVDLIRLMARLPKRTAAGMGLFMRALVDQAAVLGLMLFTLLYSGLMFHDSCRTAWLDSLRPEPVVQEPESPAEAVPLEEEPCEDVFEYCPLCEGITSPSCRYCPICSSRLPPVVLRPRTDRPKLAAIWWICRKVWFMLGGFVLEGNVAVTPEASRGFILREDDDWYRDYTSGHLERIRRMAKDFPQDGRYLGETAPVGPIEGVRIPKGETLEGISGKCMIAHFSIPSSRNKDKMYSVWLRRQRTNVQMARPMSDFYIACSCGDHADMIVVPGYKVGTPCIHGAAVVVALNRIASAIRDEAGPDPDAPDAWTIGSTLKDLRSSAVQQKAAFAIQAQEVEKLAAASEPEKDRTVDDAAAGPLRSSRAKSRASASTSRSLSLSRARRKDEDLPYSCGLCGIESRVKLTACEGACGKNCCGRCTAEQLSTDGSITLLCIVCRSAMSLGRGGTSMAYTDMETPEGRIFMLRQKVQTCAMMRADRDGVRERSKSPLEPWALQVAKETVLKCERVVSLSTEHVPDEVVDALLQAEGVNLLTPMEHRYMRFFGSQEGFEWSKADRSDANFLQQHVQVAAEPLGVVLKLLNGLEKYVALCYMMRMAASPDFKIVVCGYGFDAADFAREMVRAKQAGAQVLFLMDQGQARSATA